MKAMEVISHLKDGTYSISALKANPAFHQQVISDLKEQIRQGWPENLEKAYEWHDLLRKLDPSIADILATAPLGNEAKKLATLALENSSQLNRRAFSEKVTNELIAFLKRETDQFLYQDDEQVMLRAEAMIEIGELRQNKKYVALGKMVLGDVIIQSGRRLEEGWALLEAAGILYLQEGDLAGWARTRIGRVGHCIEADRIDKAMSEAVVARQILQRYGENDALVRLAINEMKVSYELGNYRQTIALFAIALPVALSLGEEGEKHLGLLYNNVGLAWLYRGNFHKAQTYFELAIENVTKLNKLDARDVIKQNIAYIAQAQGRYRKALTLLDELLNNLSNKRTIYAIHIKMNIVECYLYLNRISDARKLALEMMKDIYHLINVSPNRVNKNSYPNNLAQTLRYLASAEALLGQYQRAGQHLKQASRLFQSIKATTWFNLTRLLEGQIALAQRNFVEARMLASEIYAYFRSQRQQVNLAQSLLLYARASAGLGEQEVARQNGYAALWLSRKCRMPTLRYQSHTFLGNVQGQAGNVLRSKRHYQAAMRTLEGLQSDLTITLRPDFLADKEEALHGFMGITLSKSKDWPLAFQALERFKSQALLTYLTNREQFYWPTDDEASRDLILKLSRLREEHHVLYRLANEHAYLKDDDPKLDPEASRRKLIDCEKEMKAITEKLYLLSSDNYRFNPVNFPTLEALQAHLSAESVLLEYYSDGHSVWLFAVERDDLNVVKLPGDMEMVETLIEKYLFNINHGLLFDPDSAEGSILVSIIQNMSHKLYEIIFKPIRPFLTGKKRVFFIPYGLFHYFPFNTLYDGRRYLIEEFEVVTLPTASLLLQKPTVNNGRSLILAHSANGRLPFTQSETALLADKVPAKLCAEGEAKREQLSRPPGKILHIAAHGKQRIDRPALSFIQLADGQLFMDDLLQLDMAYELVVLSGCETGRVVVRPGEELIGLGRGLLCAGAGTVVASLWQVEDRQTARLMEYFYTLLFDRGEPVAAALRQAQLAILGEDRKTSPSLWGAFQLIGYAGRLSGPQA